jgi:triacylglycerol lipase
MVLNSILLIHGIDDTDAIFHKMIPYLQTHGWEVHSFSMIPSNGKVSLDRLAQQVADYVDKTFKPEQAIDLIGFSMGGIVSRYYIQRLGGIDRVQRFITISSPHQGTLTAYGRSNPGCAQMKPHSAFLNDLNQDVAQLERLNFTSIWTPFDLMILPANSSHLPVGKERKIPAGGHAWMVTDSRVLQAVAEALLEPIRSP